MWMSVSKKTGLFMFETSSKRRIPKSWLFHFVYLDKRKNALKRKLPDPSQTWFNHSVYSKTGKLSHLRMPISPISP
jgi:hypothetical protein